MFTLKRCPVCSVGASFCICSSQPSITLPFALTILSNPNEFRKPTNTARLIANCDSSVDIIEWKRREPPQILLKQIAETSVRSYVLFPSKDSVRFEEARFHKPKNRRNVRVILLDGTWKQGLKMYNHSEYLKSLPSLRLQTDRQSEYRLRNQNDPSRLSTIEAVIELIRLFQDKSCASHLSSYFKVFQWAYFDSKMNKVKEFYPKELFDFFQSIENVPEKQKPT
jgi:DTW domain-containing protein